MKNAKTILTSVDKHRDLILQTEAWGWKHPETGYREWKTHAYLKEKFEQLGYTLHEAGNIPGFYTDVVLSEDGPTVAVFGELDALLAPTHPNADPETGAVHACGHHCQYAALLGLAAALKDPAVTEGLSGTIRLIAVPAEELIELSFRRQLKEQGIIRYFGGKQEFLYRGYLDGVALSFMFHTGSGKGLRCTAGSNGFLIKEAVFTGKSAHAGGSPEKGINALYAANCAMQAANALRETFRDEDGIRFHPIITCGGSSVNAIPDRVVVESYVRGKDVEAYSEANCKLNRAFAGAAAAMGCGVRLWDTHGYAPRRYDKALKEACRQAALEVLPEELVVFTDNYNGGCSDMGDITEIMPALHPMMGGSEGTAHSDSFRIADPETACVTSAKIQLVLLTRLLEDGGRLAGEIVTNTPRKYPSIAEYLEKIDTLCMDQEAVTYGEDGTVSLRYQK